MILTLKTAPAGSALDWTSEIKGHLRLDSDTEQKRVEMLLVQTATQMAEEATGRQLITATWTMYMDCFPASGSCIEIPKAPLQSVTHVKYKDTAGVTQTLTQAGNYTTLAPSGPFAEPGRIIPDYGITYPSTYGQPNDVEVEFVAGYGATYASVPPTLRAAMLLIIGELFENRENSTTTSSGFAEIPFSARALMWPFRVWR